MVRSMCFVMVAGLTLAGCAGENRPVFDGATFRAKLSDDRADARSFVVEVRDASKTLAGAREAGRFEAVRHCIETFGNSRIDWVQGPDAEDDALRLEDGNLILTGRCAGW